MARRRPKKTTRVAAPSPRASLGRRTVYGRTEQRRPPVWKRYETKVIMVWGSVLIAAAALKKSTRAWLAQGVNLKFWGYAGMPAPSDLCPMYTLQGDTPESCAPSFVGMPPPPPPPLPPSPPPPLTCAPCITYRSTYQNPALLCM